MTERLPEPFPSDQVRASDVDRKAVQDRLHRAHAAGEIDLAEFDSRVRAAWVAKSRGELAEIMADLPEPVRRRPAPVKRSAGHTAMLVLTIIWACLGAANFAVWGLLALTLDSSVYPWWLWVVLPPGSILGVLWWFVLWRPGQGRQELD